MVTKNAFSFFILSLHFVRFQKTSIPTTRNFTSPKREGYLISQNLLGKGVWLPLGGGGVEGGIGYFLEPHILSSGRNVFSNHNTLNSLMKNPVAQETWLEKIRFQSPFFYTPLGHHKGTSCP